MTTTPFALPALPSVPTVEASEVVVPAPGVGDGYWAGGPSAILDDGAYYLAYRLRRPVGEGRGYANVLARSGDGVHFEPLVTLTATDFGCDSLERPALVRRPDGGWRVYLSLATRGTKHWSVIALDADDLDGFRDPATRTRHSVWTGDTRTVAVKDPVVMYDAGSGQWHAWVCCHPLTELDHTDRMTTRHAVSTDGLDWTWTGDALVPQPGRWDSRGTRVTAVVAGPDGLGSDGDLAFYDGRASAEENWYERTGLAVRNAAGTFTLAGTEPFAQSPFGEHTLRYASAVALPDGGLRVYFEAAAETGGNDLRTQLLDVDSLRALGAGAAPDAG